VILVSGDWEDSSISRNIVLGFDPGNKSDIRHCILLESTCRCLPVPAGEKSAKKKKKKKKKSEKRKEKYYPHQENT
jgi:hypothetical protein